jgi:hypothetical protein
VPLERRLTVNGLSSDTRVVEEGVCVCVCGCVWVWVCECSYADSLVIVDGCISVFGEDQENCCNTFVLCYRREVGAK